MDEIYKFITKVQSIAKIGKIFSKDPYALENYEELEKLSHDALESYTGEKLERPNLFARDIYPTPNISCRALILNDKNELLLVKEAAFGTWSLPGGWCDLYETPSEAIIKECRQEAGMDIKVEQLLYFADRKNFLENKCLSEYVCCFHCTIINDYHEHCHEVSEVKFFPLDNLPTISHKFRLPEIERSLEALKNGKAFFD